VFRYRLVRTPLLSFAHAVTLGSLLPVLVFLLVTMGSVLAS
jgi:hypothetical protein